MCPRTRRLAVDPPSSVVLADHALRIELGQQNHAIVLTQPLDHLALHVVDQVADLRADELPRVASSIVADAESYPSVRIDT